MAIRGRVNVGGGAGELTVSNVQRILEQEGLAYATNPTLAFFKDSNNYFYIVKNYSTNITSTRGRIAKLSGDGNLIYTKSLASGYAIGIVEELNAFVVRAEPSIQLVDIDTLATITTLQPSISSSAYQVVCGESGVYTHHLNSLFKRNWEGVRVFDKYFEGAAADYRTNTNQMAIDSTEDLIAISVRKSEGTSNHWIFLYKPSTDTLISIQSTIPVSGATHGKVPIQFFRNKLYAFLGQGGVLHEYDLNLNLLKTGTDQIINLVNTDTALIACSKAFGTNNSMISTLSDDLNISKTLMPFPYATEDPTDYDQSSRMFYVDKIKTFYSEKFIIKGVRV